jgi:hypothetical protein
MAINKIFFLLLDSSLSAPQKGVAKLPIALVIVERKLMEKRSIDNSLILSWSNMS